MIPVCYLTIININNMADSKSQEQQQQRNEISYFQNPNSNLKVESVTEGLSLPTSMAFIDGNNLLILEEEGQVRLVFNGVLQKQPVLKVAVNATVERGLLGIATINNDISNNNNANKNEDNSNNAKYRNIVKETLSLSGTTNSKIMTTTKKTLPIAKVFLYFTESKPGEPLRNTIYKYDWDPVKHLLLNQTLLLDLPALPGPNHNGGKLAIGPDHYLYSIIGNVNAGDSVLQNDRNGNGPHDTSVILRINPENGAAAPGNPFSNNGNNNNNAGSTTNKLDKYYAYGIRNSFGISFDPISGNLWDTENGENTYDEINLVKPGFNSGWQQVMGPISRSNITGKDLVNFRGSHYADPVFSWLHCVGVTDIEFLKSSKLGVKYANNIFVGDINNGNLYYLEVNKNRTGIKFGYDIDNNQVGLLSDLVADDKNEVAAITFAIGFGGITDIKTGPDGFLYILSYGNGILYRIVPAASH
jgi:glucose/arabinose dehydrogenase